MDNVTKPTESPRVALPVDEAARSLAISRALLYQLLATGAVRSFTIGRRRLVRVEELDRFARERELLAGAG